MEHSCPAEFTIKKKKYMAGSMLEKPIVGAPRQAEDIVKRPRQLSHRGTADQKKKEKKIPHKLHRPGQALMLL